MLCNFVLFFSNVYRAANHKKNLVWHHNNLHFALLLLLTKTTSLYNPVQRTKEHQYEFFKPKRINTQKQNKPKFFEKIFLSLQCYIYMLYVIIYKHSKHCTCTCLLNFTLRNFWYSLQTFTSWRCESARTPSFFRSSRRDRRESKLEWAKSSHRLHRPASIEFEQKFFGTA